MKLVFTGAVNLTSKAATSLLMILLLLNQI